MGVGEGVGGGRGEEGGEVVGGGAEMGLLVVVGRCGCRCSIGCVWM